MCAAFGNYSNRGDEIGGHLRPVIHLGEQEAERARWTKLNGVRERRKKSILDLISGEKMSQGQEDL